MNLICDPREAEQALLDWLKGQGWLGDVSVQQVTGLHEDEDGRRYWRFQLTSPYGDFRVFADGEVLDAWGVMERVGE